MTNKEIKAKRKMQKEMGDLMQTVKVNDSNCILWVNPGNNMRTCLIGVHGHKPEILNGVIDIVRELMERNKKLPEKEKFSQYLADILFQLKGEVMKKEIS
jgi:hypothetical protein